MAGQAGRLPGILAGVAAVGTVAGGLVMGHSDGFATQNIDPLTLPTVTAVLVSRRHILFDLLNFLTTLAATLQRVSGDRRFCLCQTLTPLVIPFPECASGDPLLRS